jgi:hypothetical protein
LLPVGGLAGGETLPAQEFLEQRADGFFVIRNQYMGHSDSPARISIALFSLVRAL